MSLPLNSPMSGVESSYESGMCDGRDVMRNSPVRRMDFALCELYLRFRCLLQYCKIEPAPYPYLFVFHTHIALLMIVKSHAIIFQVLINI